MIEIHTVEEYHKFLANHALCGMYYYTTTCHTCEVLKPQVTEVFKNRELPVARVNLMHLPSLAGPLHIMGVPTLILMVKGKEQKRLGAYMKMPELNEQLTELAELV